VPNASEYFAAADDIGSKLLAKVQEHDAWCDSSPVIALADRAHLYYFGLEYGGGHATSAVSRAGEQGQLAEVRVNHSRALAQTLLNLIAASKIVWQPVAVNSDYDSASQSVLAQNILEYYWQDRRVSQYFQRALEEAIVFGEGFVLTEWDDALGEPYAADESGAVVKTGDIRFTNLMSRDVIRDPRKKSYEEGDWAIARLSRNKYDLAVKATTPEQADAILRAPTTKSRLDRNFDQRPQESDDVECFYFFHKPTASMPEGREVFFVGKEVLKDGPLSYDQWPLHRVFHSELFGTPFAYTPFYEILGVQELMDSLESAVATNQTTFAVQNIAVEMGTDVDPDQISGNLRVHYYPQGGKKPEVLQLLATPAEVFKHLETKKKDQEQLMGLNSVVRGEPLTGDQSGAALALLQAQAVQQSSGLQANFIRAVEGSGNSVLEMMRKRCPLPRRIAISGKANQFLQKEQEFTGESIGLIRKVMVEAGNPLFQTPGGRLTVAKELMANGLIKTPEQYIQVILTGRLDPLTQSNSNQMLLILKENEMIANGEPPQVSVDDEHQLHAREHRGVIDNPDVRKNPQVLAVYMQHIQEHEDLFVNASPIRRMLMGQPPPPMLGPPGAPPGAPPGPGGPPPPGPQDTPPPGGVPSDLPSMPTNPSTGEPAPIPDGAALAQPRSA
jgi:hypothetical protein